MALISCWREFIFAGLALDVGLGNLETLQDALHRGADGGAHGFYTGIQINDSRVILGRGAEQAVALNNQLIILVDDTSQVIVLKADIGGNDLVRVLRVVDVVLEELHKADLGGVLDTLLLVFGGFRQGELGIAGEVGQA